jgi:hypothetical protein
MRFNAMCAMHTGKAQYCFFGHGYCKPYARTASNIEEEQS